MITRDEELKWAYLLDPCFELTNSAGKPLTDGYIEVYIAGTRNKYYCASDFSGTLHPFQIPLDSLGSNIVLANPDNAYDVYVYNRYGNLIMSRYNVTPADGGAVISNTERINELEDTLVSAVTGLQGQIDDINVTLENKKDKQEPYSVTLTPTQTVSAIIQNENGEMEVIYQEIDLPDDVPNVDIVSPASTLNITTHIDEETNTKTFSIDLSDLGHLEYGQYMATEDVITGANMYRIKGNLDTTLDGKIKLHKGNSYHITVRGAYVCTDINNSVNTLDYIEYSTFTPFHVDVDNTVTDPQNFEISYDIFKLSNDTDYYIAFAASAGKVSNLIVEIHSLSNLSVIDDGNYTAGWGINIVSSVISVDQDIFNEYTTHTEVYDSIVTAIDFVTGAMPETINLIAGQNIGIFEDNNTLTIAASGTDLSDYATHTEVYDSSVTAIQMVTGLIPDVSDFTTHTEVHDAIVTAVNTVTGAVPETIDLVAGQNIGIFDNGSTLTIAASGTDLTGYATETEVNSAIVTAINYVTGIIPDAQVQSNWEETDTSDPSYIQNKPNEYTVVAGQNIGITIDGNDFVISASGSDMSDYVTEEELIEAVTAVTAAIPAAQVQSDWTEDDNTDPAYILNKPAEYNVVAGDNIGITIDGNDFVISASGSQGTTYTAGEHIGIVNDEISVTGITELVAGNAITITTSGVSAIISSTGEAQVQSDWNVTDSSSKAYIKNKPTIPAAQVQSNWNETNTRSKAYIQNKPTIHTYTAASGINITNDVVSLDNPIGLVAGTNVTIEVSGSSAIISAQVSGGGSDVTMADLVSVSGTLETEIQAVSSAIPTVTLQSLNTAGVTDIQLVDAASACTGANILYLIPEA